jgi:hypothetical protein
MSSADTVTNARIESGDMLPGWDEMGHRVFRIARAAGPVLYGEYFFVSEEDGNDFNVEIGPFGYTDPYDAGVLDPSFREHFSAEDPLQPNK